MKVPGICAQHAIITEQCRQNRGDAGAFNEAMRRLFMAYEGSLVGWRSQGKEPNIHVILSVEKVRGADDE